jgi:hypothetical protein
MILGKVDDLPFLRTLDTFNAAAMHNLHPAERTPSPAAASAMPAAIALVVTADGLTLNTGRGAPPAIRNVPAPAGHPPSRTEWTGMLGEALAECAAPPIVIARHHGSEPTLRTVSRAPSRVRGALLLAPEVPPPLLRFSPEFGQRLPVPALVVGHRTASDLQRAQWAYWARVWGADYLLLDGDWLDGPVAGFLTGLPGRLLLQRLAFAKEAPPPRAPRSN